MKKMFLSLIFILYAVLLSWAAGERYIVFFAETSDIPEAVADKILFSKRFCMTIPVTAGSTVPAGIEELVSRGRLEPSLVFEPEPVFPILATIYSASEKKSDRQGFNEFVTGGMNEFETAVNREKFGVFLNSGNVSHNILYYFAGLKLSWVNIDNMGEPFKGAYKIDGVTTFSIYKNFPNAQKDIMKWLEARKETVVPVLLTKRHLKNAELMGYIIDLFDRSKYIKPAVPLYISLVESEMIAEKESVSFELLSVRPAVMTKLYSAVSFINEYKDSGDFLGYSYKNAQSELVYLCSHDLLKGVSANKTASQRMFDAAYNNIFRLLGAEAPSDKDLYAKKPAVKDGNLYAGTEEVMHTEINPTDGGISAENDGIIKNLTVVSKDGSINITLSFEDEKGKEEISYIDIYIDMNNFEGAGSTSMLPGAGGFLTPDSAWEYALRVEKDKVTLYRHSADSMTFLSEIQYSGQSFSIPQKYIRGNPANWGYQAVAVIESEGRSKIADFFVQSSQSRESFLSVKPFQIPAVRIKK
ncbi:MAG: hypothetical protein FWH43_07330 [Endomicrobia bacterium]|nr:hypothetical protein [Endomicrobiia bacterium]